MVAKRRKSLPQRKAVKKHDLSDLPKLLASILICEGVGTVGSLLTMVSNPSWFNVLDKPFFAPPYSICIPIWIILYLLMGISAYIVWKKAVSNKQARIALLVFTVQLALNLLWTYYFFSQHAAVAGFVAVILLWIAILATVVWFWHVSKKAALLLLPYFIWIIFAMIVNIYVLLLNVL